MSYCNDSRCPLNRQGVLHEPHDVISSRPVTSPCNDARCALTRLGMRHQAHDEQYRPQQPRQEQRRSGKEQQQRPGQPHPGQKEQPAEKIPWWQVTEDDDSDVTMEDILDELARSIRGEGSGQPRGATHTGRANTNGASSSSPSSPSKPGTNRVPHTPGPTPHQNAEARILNATDPHQVFGVPRNTTLGQIRTRYKELARMYDPSKGIIHKSESDRQRDTRIMVRINDAFSKLKAMHGGRA